MSTEVFAEITSDGVGLGWQRIGELEDIHPPDLTSHDLRDPLPAGLKRMDTLSFTASFGGVRDPVRVFWPAPARRLPRHTKKAVRKLQAWETYRRLLWARTPVPMTAGDWRRLRRISFVSADGFTLRFV